MGAPGPKTQNISAHKARARSSSGSTFVLAAVIVPNAQFCLLRSFCVCSPTQQKAIFFLGGVLWLRI